MEIGRYNNLTILRHTSVGLFLGSPDGEEVLLPRRYCPERYSIGDRLTVFVYPDNEGRKVATSLVPRIGLNEFGFLKVTAVNETGAFLDWGLDKELLVPFREQRQKMEPGRWYIVYLALDTKTNRLYASNKHEKYLQNENLTVEVGEEVEVLIMQRTELGYSAIVNHRHKGLIFKNEVYRELNVGDKLKGYIKKIREDHKLDVTLQPEGFRNRIEPDTEKLFSKLVENQGFLTFTDASSPEAISAAFGMSKKAFKRAVGALLKQGKIQILPGGISLNKSE